MSTPLNIPTELQHALEFTLFNFELAEHIGQFLKNEGKLEGRQIPTLVQMKGQKECVGIPGSNCGFFTTPVLHNAILDVRKVLTFMLLGLDIKGGGVLAPSRTLLRKDDHTIVTIGLRPVTADQLANLSLRLLGKRPDQFLLEVHIYANKQLAHLTSEQSLPDLQSIVFSCKLMREAILLFVYDASGNSRPRSRAKVEDHRGATGYSTSSG